MADRSYEYDPVSTGPPVYHQHNMETGQLWRQYVIAGIANIAIASTGYSLGWTSPVIPKLENTTLGQSPLEQPITINEGAWIGSLINIGAIFGPFLGGFAASSIGRKWGLLSSAVPLLIGWVLIAAAYNVALIYSGRIFWGIGVGMLFTISPMYCAEIATDEVRGALGSFLQGFISIGFLLVYGIGPFTTYSVIAYVGVAIVLVFTICFYWMPETPIYHLTKNDPHAAASCLATIRGRSRAEVQAELDKMQADVTASQARTATFADIFSGGNFKAFYICCGLISFQPLTGIDAVLFYMSTIFEEAGSALEPAIATIIIGVIQMIASFITPFVVDRFGRRILLFVSSCGTAVGLGFLGVYFILKSNGSPVVDSISWLPILALMLFIVMFCLGIGSVPWVLIGELFAIEVKALTAPIATAYCWAVNFLVTRYFTPIAEAVGMGTAFLIFCAFSVICFFFTLFLVPETKGKSFEEIQDMLAGRSLKKSEKS